MVKRSASILLTALLISSAVNTQLNGSEGKMDGFMKVKNLWQEMFDFWKTNNFNVKCTGATDEEIHDLEKNIGMKLPQILIESLKICNGEKVTGFSRGWIGIYSTRMISDMYNGLVVYHSDWQKHWIPFYGWDVTRYYGVIDLKNNQILCAPGDDMPPYPVWKNSYEDWLEMMVNEVKKHGTVREELFYDLVN